VEVWRHTGCCGALVELAYGTTILMPAGISRHEIMDLFDEFQRQFGR